MSASVPAPQRPSPETRVAIRGDRPLALDRDGLWLVREGRVDVFAVRMRDGEAMSSRLHLARIEAGGALFGADIRGPGELVLLATGTPETSANHLDAVQVREWLRDEQLREEQVTLLDDWISHLSAGLAGCERPTRCADLVAQQATTLEHGASAGTAGEVLWITLSRGHVRYDGLAAAGIEPGETVPLSGAAWCESVGGAALHANTTQQSLDGGEAWGGLRRLHGVVLDCADDRMTALQEREAERLRAKASARQLTLRGAVARLAETMHQRLVAVSTDGPTSCAGTMSPEEQLLAVCQTVGRALGMTIKAPPNAREGAGSRSPLDQIAHVSRVGVRRVALRGAWWNDDCGPLVARRQGDQAPVALLPRPTGGYDVIDPVAGTRTRLDAALAEGLESFAHSLYRAFPDTPLGLREVLHFGVQGCTRDLGMAAAMGAAIGALGMVTPLATGALFNSVIPDSDVGQLVQLTMVLAVCAVTASLFQIMRGVAMLRIEARMGAAIQSAVWQRLLSLPMPFFRQYAAGDLAVRAMGIDEIRRTLSGTVLNALLTSIFSVFNFALLFRYDVALALRATLLIGIALAATLLAGMLQLRSQRSAASLRSRTSGVVLQLLSGVAKLKTVGAEMQAFAVWARLFGTQRDAQFRSRQIGNALAAFNVAFPVVASLAIFTVAGAQAQSLSTGDFLAFIAAFNLCLIAMLTTSAAVIGALGTIPMYEQAKSILVTTPEVNPAKTDPGVLRGGIELRHVAFRYRADGPAVLRDISVQVAPGEFVAFVGPSGSGKSTILRLLLGFESPEAGALFFDDQDLSGLDVQAVRRQMGVVLQNGRLTSGDLFTNIAGSSNATLDDAWEAARSAGLEDDIRRMPMGMHTVVSEGGGTLSGGQRQRLMIARAIVNRPRILLFDEATSALDNRTQEIVSRSLDRLHATRIVIAHRLSTIVQADRICVIHGGLVAEQGRYEELIARDGLFAALAKRQLA